jgi:hypothetical protein
VGGALSAESSAREIAEQSGITRRELLVRHQKYVEQNADKLRAIVVFERGRGFTTDTLVE